MHSRRSRCAVATYCGFGALAVTEVQDGMWGKPRETHHPLWGTGRQPAVKAVLYLLTPASNSLPTDQKVGGSNPSERARNRWSLDPSDAFRLATIASAMC